MKSLFRNILLVSIACLCVFSFVSCGNGIKGDEAKALINDFFAAIVAEDYDKAESFLHPERPADLEAFLLNVEQEKNVDFQADIQGVTNTFQTLMTIYEAKGEGLWKR